MKALSHDPRSRISRTTARHSGAIFAKRRRRPAAERSGSPGSGRPFIEAAQFSFLVQKPMKQLADGALADLGDVGVPEHQRSVKDLVAEGFSLVQHRADLREVVFDEHFREIHGLAPSFRRR